MGDNFASDNTGWVAAFISAVASIIIAYRKFRKDGISAEEAQNIIKAAMLDLESKRAVLEERNLAVHLREVEKDRRQELEEQMKVLRDSLDRCTERYEELLRTKGRAR
jgi:hypothetical protein